MDGKDKSTSSFVLNSEELRAISAHAQTRAFPRNAVVLNEGDRTDSLYIILEGRVKAFLSDPDGKEIVLSTQGAGEYFGEMVLDEGPRSASVMTLEPSRFLIVPKADFKDWALAHVERIGPKDDVLVQYSLPEDRVMSQTISNNFHTALLAALGSERAELTIYSSARDWMCESGILCTKNIVVRRHADGRLTAQEGDYSPFDLIKLSYFPRWLRSVFPNGWADVAEREGFELPPPPVTK